MIKSLEVSPFPAGDHKAARHRQGNMWKTDTDKKDPQESQGGTYVYLKTHVCTTRRCQFSFLSYLFWFLEEKYC